MAKKPTVNVTIPVYNEEAELKDSVLTLRNFLHKYMQDYDCRIYVADNASTDKTLQIGRELAANYSDVKVVHLDLKGRGRAVKHVWQTFPADYHAYMDVDLSSDLKHFPNLINALTRGYDVAIGSRNTHGSRVYGRSLLRTITSKGYITLIKLFFWVHFSDAQCGFKAVTAAVVKSIIPHVVDNEWFFDTEFLLMTEKSGRRIYDEPVTWIDNPGSTVRVLKTAQGDLRGLWRLFKTQPWKQLSS
jgi:glycosyltransferase involved in cell wall biosynthesis